MINGILEMLQHALDSMLQYREDAPSALGYADIVVIYDRDVLTIRTLNRGFPGAGVRHYRLYDGAVVVTWERELGIPTGEEFLPPEWYELPWKED